MASQSVDRIFPLFGDPSAGSGPVATNQILWVNVSQHQTVTVQAVEMTPASGSPVLTVYRSNDGATPVALSTPQTLAAPGMTPSIDCSAFAWLAVALTATGTAGQWRVYVCAKNDR